MDRTQKKCVAASTGFHLLLLLILLIGPAFVAAHSKKADDVPILDFIPVKTVDSLMSGGGDPRGAAPPAGPEAVKPEPPKPEPPKPEPPKPEPVVAPPPPKPEPRPEPVKEKDVKPVDKKPDPDSLEPAEKPQRRKPNITTEAVTRPRDTEAEKRAREAREEAREEARAAAEAREYAQRVADNRRRLASALGGAANAIENGKSGSTSVLLRGPGGGGAPYANFLAAVKTIYQRAWILPDGVSDDDATVSASVTIARDGTVVSWKVLRNSGAVGVDESVRRALQRVKFAVPLPEEAKESERTVNINFNVATKRALG
jgi:colicin import membrane protein